MLLSTEDVDTVFRIFQKENPEPETELESTNAYTLLVAVSLSAQATDKSVNLATRNLFPIADTPEKMLSLGEEGLIPLIRSIGLYRSKSKHIIEMSRLLVENFNSQVPATREELLTLPGVGRKTANVILNVLYGQKTMPVDTHILRIAPRIGLAAGTTPDVVEEELCRVIPDCYMKHAHHWLVLHGRYVCTARAPKCSECCIRSVCMKNL